MVSEAESVRSVEVEGVGDVGVWGGGQSSCCLEPSEGVVVEMDLYLL